MGSSGSEIPEQNAAYLKRFQKINSVDDPRYGKLTIYQDLQNPGHFVARKEKWTNARSTYR